MSLIPVTWLFLFSVTSALAAGGWRRLSSCGAYRSPSGSGATVLLRCQGRTRAAIRAAKPCDSTSAQWHGADNRQKGALCAFLPVIQLFRALVQSVLMTKSFKNMRYCSFGPILKHAFLKSRSVAVFFCYLTDFELMLFEIIGESSCYQMFQTDF